MKLIVEATYGQGSNVITKKALVAWEKICTPMTAGGLNLINFKLWNTAAIAKSCWDLAHKKDKLWIKWIHIYYIKTQQFFNVQVPQQVCWMVRKILEARPILELVQFNTSSGKSLIRIIYMQLLGNLPRVAWKCMIFNNDARPNLLCGWLYRGSF